METGLKLATLQGLWHGKLKNFFKKCKKSKLQKLHGIIKKSIQNTQLKLFNAVLKHEIIESNKETFNERLN